MSKVPSLLALCVLWRECQKGKRTRHLSFLKIRNNFMYCIFGSSRTCFREATSRICGRSRVRFPSSPMLWGCGAVVAQPLRMLFGFVAGGKAAIERLNVEDGQELMVFDLLSLESANR
jgi:hypothetical protein